MGQVKIKFKKIHETLDDYEISRPHEQLIDDFFTLYRSLHHIVRYANDVNDYGSEFSKKFYAVSRLKEKIDSLVLAASFNPVKEINKKMLKLTKRVLRKAHMIEAAYKIIASMSSLEQDPVADMSHVIFNAEFDKDIKKLKKQMKEHVLRVIANSPEKPNIDYDKLLDKEERNENRIPVSIEVVVGIRELYTDADNPKKTIYLDDGLIKAGVVSKGKVSYLQISQTKGLEETNTYQFAIKRRVCGGSTVEKQIKLANNLMTFINEIMELSYCRAVQSAILFDKYGLDPALLCPEPKNDKNAFFENCERLSIYVEIIVNNGNFEYAYASAFNAYSRAVDISYDITDTDYLKYEISECEDFESKFNSGRLLGNMIERPQEDDE